MNNLTRLNHHCMTWFVVRMAIVYCAKEITTHDGFLGFSTNAGGALNYIEELTRMELHISLRDQFPPMLMLIS